MLRYFEIANIRRLFRLQRDSSFESGHGRESVVYFRLLFYACLKIMIFKGFVVIKLGLK